MAGYAETANSVFDPQAAAETTQAAAGRDASVAALDTQDKALAPKYGQAKDALTTGHKSNEAGIDFRNTEALDGQRSGLTDNAQSAEGSSYIKGLTSLSSEEAAAHDSIASLKAQATNQYQAAASSILSKYSGLKSGYVSDMLNRDSQNAFQQKLANDNNALQLKIAGINSAGRGAEPTPSTNQLLAKYFIGYQPAKEGGKAFFTERSVIPALMADSGMSYNDAAKQAYAFRKQNFKE